MYDLDPHQHIREGVAYPATLVISGLNDPHAATFHSAKYAARLAAGTASDEPVLLRIDFGAGHRMGSKRCQLDEVWTDVYAFALWQGGGRIFSRADAATGIARADARDQDLHARHARIRVRICLRARRVRARCSHRLGAQSRDPQDGLAHAAAGCGDLLLSGLVAGIGFIGGGAILKSNDHVKGTATSASILFGVLGAD